MSNFLHCGNCRKVVSLTDIVYLDEINTVTHENCYKPNFKIKDQGTFKEIIDKYSFFEELKNIYEQV